MPQPTRKQTTKSTYAPGRNIVSPEGESEALGFGEFQTDPRTGALRPVALNPAGIDASSSSNPANGNPAADARAQQALRAQRVLAARQADPNGSGVNFMRNVTPQSSTPDLGDTVAASLINTGVNQGVNALFRGATNVVKNGFADANTNQQIANGTAGKPLPTGTVDLNLATETAPVDFALDEVGKAVPPNSLSGVDLAQETAPPDIPSDSSSLGGDQIANTQGDEILRGGGGQDLAGADTGAGASVGAMPAGFAGLPSAVANASENNFRGAIGNVGGAVVGGIVGNAPGAAAGSAIGGAVAPVAMQTVQDNFKREVGDRFGNRIGEDILASDPGTNITAQNPEISDEDRMRAQFDPAAHAVGAKPDMDASHVAADLNAGDTLDSGIQNSVGRGVEDAGDAMDQLNFINGSGDPSQLFGPTMAPEPVQSLPAIFGGGGHNCFITEAVTSSSGVGDNAEELQVLRAFRDNVMATTPQGNALIQEYYAIAPVVVDSIGQRPDGLQIFQSMKSQFIDPAVQAVKNGDNEGALRIYAQMLSYATNFVVPEGHNPDTDDYPDGSDDGMPVGNGVDEFGAHADQVADQPGAAAAVVGGAGAPQQTQVGAGGPYSPSSPPSSMPSRMMAPPPTNGIMPRSAPPARPAIGNVFAGRA